MCDLSSRLVAGITVVELEENCEINSVTKPDCCPLMHTGEGGGPEDFSAKGSSEFPKLP